MELEQITGRDAAVALMCGAILVTIGACALAYASFLLRLAFKRLRLAELGARLLEVCAGDWQTAEDTIDSCRTTNDVFDAALLRGMRNDRELTEYARRRAEFNAACQDLSGIGPRWMDTV